MDGYRDLRLVLMALRSGLADPARLAEAGLNWSPASPTPLWEHLAEQGVIPPDRLRELETPTVVVEAGPPPAGPPAGNGSTLPYPGATATPAGAPVDPSGRYEVLRLHRTGGIGQVWLARDTAVGREVALKVLRPDRADSPDVRGRFVREARTTGQLEHPSVVPLYDLIERGARGPCYAMRFVAGRTLAEAAEVYHRARAAGRAGPLDLAALLDAFVAVCRAVAFAHARGVLHRDLKGQNVVLGDFGEVFLLDWGLAKGTGDPDTPPPAHPTAADAADGTRPGSVVGTPAFMAPEVADGEPATAAADVYGLGAILYVILTGKPPYDGPIAAEVIEKVLATDPPAPRSVNPSAPPALEAVCRRAMARDPASRYESADELATEVRRWEADEPVRAYRDPWTVRATRWARRHRTPVAAAAVFLLTAVAALGASTALVWREKQRTSEQKRAAELQSDALAKLTGRMIDVAEAGLAPVPESEPARIDLITAALDTYDGILADRPNDPAVRLRVGMLHRYRGNLYRLTDRLGEAEDDYRQAVALLRPGDGAPPDDPVPAARFTEARVDYAEVMARTGRLSEAAGVLAEEARSARDKRMSAFLLVNLADVEADRGRWDEAAREARQAADLYRGFESARPEYRHPYDPLFLALAARTAAAAERSGGARREAAAELTAAIDRLTRLAAAPSRGLNADDVRNVLGRCLVERAFGLPVSDRAAAEGALGRAIAQWDELTARHPHIRDYRARAAYARQVRGRLLIDTRPADAQADLTAARDVLEKLAAEVPQRIRYAEYLAGAYTGLGRLAGTERDPAGAKGAYEKALAILRPAVARSPDSAEARQLLAEAERGLRELDGGDRR